MFAVLTLSIIVQTLSFKQAWCYPLTAYFDWLLHNQFCSNKIVLNALRTFFKCSSNCSKMLNAERNILIITHFVCYPQTYMECKQSIVIFNHQVLTDVLLFTHLVHLPAQTGPPQASWASGESGGTSRLNVDTVNSQCDLVAERERQNLMIINYDGLFTFHVGRRFSHKVCDY